MECRDRKGKEDITWIEQLASKRDDIGADKAIAVSSSGFTSGAISKAQFNNIKLRTVENITLDDISNWFQISFLRHQTLLITNAKAGLHLKNPQKDQKIIAKFLHSIKDEDAIQLKIFIDEDVSRPLSIGDLLIKKYQKIKDGKSNIEVKKRINAGKISPKNKRTGFQILFENQIIKIDHITFSANLEVISKNVGIQSIKSYKTPEGTLADVIRFESLNSPKSGPQFEMTSIPEGEGRKFSIRVIE